MFENAAGTMLVDIVNLEFDDAGIEAGGITPTDCGQGSGLKGSNEEILNTECHDAPMK